MSRCLREANPELCLEKNEYDNEYCAYLNKRTDMEKQVAVKNKDGSVLIETGERRLTELENSNKELIEKYRTREKEIKAYQFRNRAKGLSLFVKYFDDLGW